MAKNALIQGRDDNVATALEPLAKGVEVCAVYHNETPVKTITRDEVPFGFKVAIKPIAKGQPILKYGMPIGCSSQDIQPGDMVHIHNVDGSRGRGDKHE